MTARIAKKMLRHPWNRKSVCAMLTSSVDLFGESVCRIDGVAEEDDRGFLPPPNSRSIEVVRGGIIEVKDYGEENGERTVIRSAYIWPAPGSVVTYTGGK